ncbi:MAG: CAP domain-containing protein [Nocardioides sp.]
MMTLTVLRSARRLLVTGLVAATAAVGMASATPATATATAPTTALVTTAAQAVSPSLDSGYYEKRVQYWINVRRQQHGLGTLRLATCTDNVAEHWSSYLASTNSFYHQSMSTILNKCNAYYAGETLGRGSISPKRLVYLWMHSAEHRPILLSHYPRRIGIGAYPDSYGQWVVAADFMRF